jgi:hypothetical protein
MSRLPIFRVLGGLIGNFILIGTCIMIIHPVDDLMFERILSAVTAIAGGAYLIAFAIRGKTM